ncbi:MAG: GNAT family N-acetyltransferase [Candidatus Diapherotrites archaeon]|nr:GNAT family N-acetyltransferase [Candidatus Diapherotrites archaeon]
MVKIKFRSFKSQDTKSIVGIAKALGYFTLKDLKNIKDCAFKDHCVVAEAKSRPVGFIVFKAHKKDSKIHYLAVRRDFQGFGLGGRLLKRAESHIKTHKAKKVVLHTFGFSGNYQPFLKVRDFYYRNGFQRLREIPNGFVNGVDKLIMVKEFN